MPPKDACSNFRLQSDAWTPELVKTGLSCALYSKGNPSEYFNRVAALPEESFTETAHWLNAQLKPAKRARFFANLDEFPKGFDIFLSNPQNTSFLLNPALVEKSAFIDAGLKLMAASDAKLHRSFQKIIRLSQSGGRWHPSDEMIGSFLDFTRAAKGLSPPERRLFLETSTSLTDRLADRLEIQRSLGLLTHDIPCHKGQGIVIEAPLDFSFQQLLSNRDNPERFFAVLGQTYIPWRKVCEPTAADFSSARISDLLEFVNENFEEAAAFGTLALKIGAHRTASQILMNSSGAMTPLNRNVLSLLKESELYASFFDLIANNEGPGAEWLAQMPSNEEVLGFFEKFSYENILNLAQLPPEGIQQLSRLVSENIAPHPALLAEWQSLLATLGPNSIIDFGEYVRAGKLKELVDLFMAWTGEKRVHIDDQQKASTQTPSTAPAKKAENERPKASRSLKTANIRQLIDKCLRDESLSVGQAYSCIREYSLVDGISFPFFESRAFENFITRIDGSDPIFGLAESAKDMGWLEDPESYENFFLTALDALRPYRLPFARLLFTAAKGVSIPDHELKYFSDSLAEFRLPTLKTTRMLRLGYTERNTPINGLPSDWKEWLTETFPVKLASGMFDDPLTLQFLSQGVRKRFDIPMELVDDQKQLRTEIVPMNGLEIIDSLIWEVQVETAVGHGDRFIMKTLVGDMRKLKTAENVVAWLESNAKMVERGIRFFEFFHAFNPVHMLARLHNARTLMRVLQTEIPPEVFVAASRMSAGGLPDQASLDQQTAIFTLQHRLGLFPALSKWLEKSSPLALAASEGGILLDADSIRMLGEGFAQYLRASTEADIWALSKVNLLADGELLASCMDLYIRAAQTKHEQIYYWTSAILGQLTLPIFKQIADNSSVVAPRDAMAHMFPKIQSLMNELSQRLRRDFRAHALKRFIRFANVRATEAGTEDELAKAELVKMLTEPATRPQITPWIRSGALRSFVEWSRHVRSSESRL